MGKNRWISIFRIRCLDLLTKSSAPPLEEEEGPFPDLPHDIMIDILTRLPAKCIFPLLQQSNSIGLTTTTRYFKRTHLARATPTIVVQSTKSIPFADIKLFLCDDNAEIVEATRLKLRLFNDYCKAPIDLCGSYDGFLLFKSHWSTELHLCILNPITKEQVILISPDNIIFVCGFYFHPRKKEYQVVCARRLAGKQIMWEFQILSLRTKQRRSVGSCSYPPSKDRWPVFIHGTFYWMVDYMEYWGENQVYPSISESILSFNIETEEFSTMEAVMPSNYALQLGRNESQLFELEGDLSLFDPSSSVEVVIWVFNYSTKRWDKTHSIPSPVYKHDWRFSGCFSHIEYINTKGEFIAYRPCEKYSSYIYNLRLGTWKLFERKGFEDVSFRATIHTHSLVSLDAADSVISL